MQEKKKWLTGFFSLWDEWKLLYPFSYHSTASDSLSLSTCTNKARRGEWKNRYFYNRLLEAICDLSGRFSARFHSKFLHFSYHLMDKRCWKSKLFSRFPFEIIELVAKMENYFICITKTFLHNLNYIARHLEWKKQSYQFTLVPLDASPYIPGRLL